MPTGRPLPERTLALITRDLLRRRHEARKMRASLVVEALEAQRACTPSEPSRETPVETGSETVLLRAAAAFQRIADIDDALARVATSDFGRCAECGADIPYQRLKALPTATPCYSCPNPAGSAGVGGSIRSMEGSLS